jgi:putative ABC transport system ATP-binding protein
VGRHSTNRRLAVRCRGITKTFGQTAKEIRAVDGVDIDVMAGEMTFLVGPSGCGKTTLISVIAGALKPDKGEINVFGTVLNRLSRARAARFRAEKVGFVLQQFNLFPALTARENVAVPLLVQGVDGGRAHRRASVLLGDLEMTAHEQKFPEELSVGQQQRVAIARALIHQPSLVVCDEPTAALDAAAGKTAMTLLRRVALREDRAVIVVTHDPRIVGFADRIAHMSDGQITQIEPDAERGAA